MPIITADETRTRLATPLTAEQLDTKYGLVQALISAAADEGKYQVPVSLGSDEQAQFTAWIQGYGYRVIATDQVGTQIRKIVGSSVNLAVFWNKITASVASASVVRGNPIYVNLTSVGWASMTVYWTITGTVLANELIENTLTGSVALGSDGAGTVSLNVLASAGAGHTATMRFYGDSNRTQLVSTAVTVTITV